MCLLSLFSNVVMPIECSAFGAHLNCNALLHTSQLICTLLPAKPQNVMVQTTLTLHRKLWQYIQVPLALLFHFSHAKHNLSITYVVNSPCLLPLGTIRCTAATRNLVVN